MKHNKTLVLSILFNIMVTIGILTLATFLGFLFRAIGFHESNIIVAYILGVLLVAKQTEGHIYGILASIFGVLTFNFFFTEPYYTFVTYSPEYPVTFIIMLIAAIITSTLTAKAKREAMISSIREKRTNLLYGINKSLIKVRSIHQIAEVGGKNIAKLFDRSVIIVTVDAMNHLSLPYIYALDNDNRVAVFKSFIEMKAITETFEKGRATGAGTNTYPDSLAYYLPIKGLNSTLGVIGVSCFEQQLLSAEQKRLLESVATQISLAIEREHLYEKQQKAKMDVESEQLRSNLLRAISHDLRTPLAGILGATSTILDNDEILDDVVKKELLQNIYKDTNWLIHTVENILSITKIDEGRIEIKKSMEAVEEIIADTLSRVNKLVGNHIIEVDIPNELILLPMDGILIRQVLLNLVDNGIKYTPEDSKIEIKVWTEFDKVIFEVSDNGNGIPQERIPFIFDRYYTAPIVTDSGKRGTGLGLAICKSIIAAHGGEISVDNNASGGATFRFSLNEKE